MVTLHYGKVDAWPFYGLDEAVNITCDSPGLFLELLFSDGAGRVLLKNVEVHQKRVTYTLLGPITDDAITHGLAMKTGTDDAGNTILLSDMRIERDGRHTATYTLTKDDVDYLITTPEERRAFLDRLKVLQVGITSQVERAYEWR